MTWSATVWPLSSTSGRRRPESDSYNPTEMRWGPACASADTRQEVGIRQVLAGRPERGGIPVVQRRPIPLAGDRLLLVQQVTNTV